MKRRRMVWLAAVPVAFILILSFLTGLSTATALNLSSNADCTVTLAGTVTAVDTCTVSSLTIAASDSLTITSAWTLVVGGPGLLTVDGQIYVQGVLDNGIVSPPSNGVITIDTSGSIEIETAANLNNWPGSQINVFGSLIVDNGAFFENDGVVGVSGALTGIDNYGTSDNAAGASITASAGGGFYNAASGTFTNEGTVSTSWPGWIRNEGTFGNSASLQLSGEFDNFGHLTNTNSGTISVNTGSVGHGYLVVESASVVLNFGLVLLDSGSGTYIPLQISGEFANEPAGSLVVNYAAYIFSGGDIENVAPASITVNYNITIFDGGQLWNTVGAWVNVSSSGSIVVKDPGSLLNEGILNNAGVIQNFGDVNNDFSPVGYITNPGTIYNECGGTIEIGPHFSGNPVQYIPCPPVITTASGHTFNTPTPTITGTSDIYSGGGGPLQILLYANATPVGNGFTTDSAGDWSITTIPLAAGSYHMSSYAVDAQSWISAVSNIVPINIVIATTTTVACVPFNLPVGTETNCVATVSESGGGPPVSPLGIVSFTDPGGVFTGNPCSLSPISPGSSSCSVVYVPGSGSEGPIVITGTYSPTDFHLASAGSYTITATQLNSVTTPACTPNPVAVNAPTTCTATVTDNPGTANIPPSGTVSFSTSGTGAFSSGGVCTLSTINPHSASCSVMYTPALGSEGTPTIGASYSGDIDHTTSSGNTVLTVIQRSTSTGVTCSPNPIPVNAPTTCVVTVTDTSPGTTVTPTGTVTFGTSTSGLFSGGGMCTLSGGTCSVTYTPAPGSEGLTTITGTYSGDTDHFGGAGHYSLTVTKRSTSTVLTCSPSPLPVNAPVTCVAGVSDTSFGTPITPTGTVSFSSNNVGSFSSTTCPLFGGTCFVYYTPGSGSEGSTTITVTYPGDTDHTGSVQTAGIFADKRTTTTALTCLPTTVAVNNPTTCKATVTDTSSGTVLTPTGTVSFGSTGLGHFSGGGLCTLVAGSCLITYTPTSGSEGSGPTLTATYLGDTDHTGSAGTFVGPVTTQRTSSTTVSCAKPYDQGKKLTCTITVKDTTAGAALTPTGTISVSVVGPKGYSTVVTCVLSGSGGTATCKMFFVPTHNGNYTATATFPGDVDHSGSSGAKTVNVT